MSDSFLNPHAMNTPFESPLVATPTVLAPWSADLTDAEVTAALHTLLTTKKGLSAHRIAVSTHEGVVAMTGFTDNLLPGMAASCSPNAAAAAGGATQALVPTPLGLSAPTPGSGPGKQMPPWPGTTAGRTTRRHQLRQCPQPITCVSCPEPRN